MPGLFAEAARLGGGIVQLAHAGTPDQVRAAERLLERTRRELYRILADDEDATTRQMKTSRSLGKEARQWTIASGFQTPTGNA